ncbi:Hypothetical predicted protein [Cloeon dipterum]|uniref:Peptidase S1 domain-containing protein n=1 Tax=Cloeon dipterum TaxID=197152 RepID=A0A8S1DRY7_9INSE|nr:Hypothetical predicted protein [Cloeon dipterum]
MLCNIVVLIVACCATLACGNPLELQQSLAKASNLQAFGGIPAARGEFPWHVSLQHFATFAEGWVHRCEGTIISESYVIASSSLLCYPSRGNVRAVAGTLEWTRPRSIHNVTEFIEGDFRSGSLYLALFKVDPPFQFDCYTKAVQLPDHYIESLPGTVMTTTGWGHMMCSSSSSCRSSPKPYATRRVQLKCYTSCAPMKPETRLSAVVIASVEAGAPRSFSTANCVVSSFFSMI